VPLVAAYHRVLSERCRGHQVKDLGQCSGLTLTAARALGLRALALVGAPEEIANDEEDDKQKRAAIPKNRVQNRMPLRD
jgi:hypothetical protein